MSKVYCGIKQIPRGQQLGTEAECFKANQVRYYGLQKVKMNIPGPKKQKDANPAVWSPTRKIQKVCRKQKNDQILCIC